MKKSVRYIIGAVGAVPAIGLVTPTAMAATGAHAALGKAGKTVSLLGRAAPAASTSASPGSLATCAGHNKHSATSGSGFYMKFYSTPEGTKTCIGLVNLEATHHHVSGSVFSLSMEVFNKNGNFCIQKYNGSSHNFHCNHTFIRNRLAVSGAAYGIQGSFRSWHVRDAYPF